jgi:hypothetical protein
MSFKKKEYNKFLEPVRKYYPKEISPTTKDVWHCLGEVETVQLMALRLGFVKRLYLKKQR